MKIYLKINFEFCIILVLILVIHIQSFISINIIKSMRLIADRYRCDRKYRNTMMTINNESNYVHSQQLAPSDYTVYIHIHLIFFI